MFELTVQEWRNICPDLTVDQCATIEPLPFTVAELTSIADQFWKTGYLNIPQLLSPSELEPIISAFNALQAANIPPVYIYIFDQPWVLFEKLRTLISHFLGDKYALLPNFWAWHLSEHGKTGWPPHRDCDAETVFQIGPDPVLMSLSLWIPLSDVDEENGCMSVVARSEEINLPEDGRLNLEDLSAYATCLPAKAGSVLGWRQDLVHWGGEFTPKAKTPRISLSFEFQNRFFDPLVEPLLDTGHPPKFTDRVALLGAQFDKYKHIDPDLG